MRACLIVASSVLVACASGSRRAPAPRPAPEQQERLVEAERLYRASDPKFAAARDELAADPVSARWLTRLLIRDVLWARDQRRSDDAAFLAAVAGRSMHPTEERALRQLRALGAASAPGLIEDLLKHKFTDRQQIGAELLGHVGPATLPALQPLLSGGDRRRRRLAAQALVNMEKTPPVCAALERAVGDGEFTVRATAWRGLARAGEVYAPRLRAVLTDDDDPYVRRVVAAELAAFADRDSAAALVGYLERCVNDGDGRGREAAEAALVKLAGSKPRGGLSGWRGWLSTYTGGS